MAEEFPKLDFLSLAKRELVYTEQESMGGYNLKILPELESMGIPGAKIYGCFRS